MCVVLCIHQTHLVAKVNHLETVVSYHNRAKYSDKMDYSGCLYDAQKFTNNVKVKS